MWLTNAGADKLSEQGSFLLENSEFCLISMNIYWSLQHMDKTDGRQSSQQASAVICPADKHYLFDFRQTLFICFQRVKTNNAIRILTQFAYSKHFLLLTSKADVNLTTKTVLLYAADSKLASPTWKLTWDTSAKSLSLHLLSGFSGQTETYKPLRRYLPAMLRLPLQDCSPLGLQGDHGLTSPVSSSSRCCTRTMGLVTQLIGADGSGCQEEPRFFYI